MMKVLVATIALVALDMGTALAGPTPPPSTCSVNDVSLTIGSTAYAPSSCASDVNPSNANLSTETAALNADLGTAFSGLAKSDGTSVTYNGLRFSVSAAAAKSGGWTVSWQDTNGAAPLNLPVVMDLAVGLFGGSNGDGYLFQDVLLPVSPSSGSGSFSVTFFNNGGKNPALSHLTLIGGDARPVPAPEPMSVALFGSSLLGLGIARRWRRR